VVVVVVIELRILSNEPIVISLPICHFCSCSSCSSSSSSHHQVHEMNTVGHRARRVLTDMARRAAREKAILYTIIILLIAANLGVLYRLFTNHGHLF